MRLKNIVLTDLINERLVAYEELERVMNSRDSIENTVKKSKHYLRQIVRLSAMIEEWQQINQPESQIDFDKLADQLTQQKDG